jgi:hypothetical protein
MTDYDGPWKEMLDGYFPDFMAFFFPDAYRDIDWSRGYESLDTELQQIVRDAELGRRLADKLMKVWRRNGAEQVVMIHVEVQGDRKTEFLQRMYIYHYRFFDRYGGSVVSIAVLADDDPGWRPSDYGYELWGCRIRLEFPTVKLLDYEPRRAEWENSDNPFAIIVLAHLQSQRERNNPEGRLLGKLALIRRLYERGYERQAILDLFRFIDWVLELPEDLEIRFEAELEQLEEERRMRYVTSIERRGIEKGLQQGLQQEASLLLKKLLNRRFGELPAWVEERLANASREELEYWVERVLEAQRLEEVFAVE